MNKICIGCEKEKSIDDFPKYKRSKDGHAARCKVCHNEETQKYIDRIGRDKIKASQVKTHLRQRYGMTPEEYNAKLIKQSGLCAICQSPETIVRKSRKVIRLSVDHDHGTNKPRDLLCHRCNMLLGLAKDDILLLQICIDYLKRHKGGF